MRIAVDSDAKHSYNLNVIITISKLKRLSPSFGLRARFTTRNISLMIIVKLINSYILKENGFHRNGAFAK
ncbi:hypothetical protein BBD42_21285 [Paenibacillus sp. BIHB 4019]|uniref:Uncharacterized protein n=1 Tax=Paenibacillus sp. BIHB 4019 TaxID=1870819 RepID=A0A1B2DLY5_9BACL|nr:hypothetical protein BBD42_21285 [Paenibacillus sp. BIHB 4019]